jgi:hypothetical protein
MTFKKEHTADKKKEPEGYISKDIYILSYIQKSQKDISYLFLEQDILRI